MCSGSCSNKCDNKNCPGCHHAGRHEGHLRWRRPCQNPKRQLQNVRLSRHMQSAHPSQTSHRSRCATSQCLTVSKRGGGMSGNETSPLLTSLHLQLSCCRMPALKHHSNDRISGNCSGAFSRSFMICGAYFALVPTTARTGRNSSPGVAITIPEQTRLGFGLEDGAEVLVEVFSI